MLNKLKVEFDERSNRLLFRGSDFCPEFCDVADFWRLHLDYCIDGKNRELGVYSHLQTPASVVSDEGMITISYDNVVAENGITYPIGLKFVVREIEDELDFSVEIDNQSEVRLNELQYPVVEMKRISEPLEKDVLYVPAGLGTRVENPLAHVQAEHTEYIAADFKNTWKQYCYPGPLSMPFMGVQSGKYYLALSRRDAEVCHLTLFNLGTGPREEKTPRFIMTISSFPAVMPGEKMAVEHLLITVSDRDWREVVDVYRAWSNKTWLAPELDENGQLIRKESVRHMHGWQRIILKHQYGEVIHKFSDLPRIYKEGERYGLRLILLFGWCEAGFNNQEPCLEPDEELGGAEGLRKAIREINEMGGQVVLYFDCMLIDKDSDFYKEEAYKYTKKNMNQQEYLREFRFANNGSILRFSGYRHFAVGCFGSDGWRNKLLEMAERKLELGSNGAFFDEFGCAFYLCFDNSHNHGNRIDLEPQERVDISQEIRKKVNQNNPEEWFGSEWAFDRICVLTDYTHGYGPSLWYKPDSYPYMFRYGFPEVKISNRWAHDEKDIYRSELFYCFVHGMLFDVGLYRSRIDSIDDCPNYAALVGRLVALREQYCDFFVDGKFDLPSMELPQGCWGAEYTLGEHRILAIWNDTNEDLEMGGNFVAKDDVAVWTLA